VERTLKILMLIVLVGLILSCDVFFVSKGGRYNTLDPKSEFVEISTEIDGYANPSEWLDKYPTLTVNESYPAAAFLRFNVDQIPDDFDRIYLRLYKYVTNPGAIIRIHPVLVDRPPTAYAEAEDESYHDTEIYTRHLLNTAEGLEYISLDSIVNDEKSNIRFGVVIFADYEYADFASTEEDTAEWQPRLCITTK